MENKRIVEIHMHNRKRTVKPKDGEIGKISNAVVKQIFKLDIKTFATEVGENGKTFTPALFTGHRDRAHYKEQKVFALDFDNSISVSDFMSRVNKYGIFPVFLYETFNCSKSDVRFRAVFVNDCTIKSIEEFEIIINLLFFIFPEADPMCKEPSRMFFGGKKVIYLNEYAEINVKSLAIAVQVMLKEKDSKNFARELDQLAREFGLDTHSNLLEIHRLDEIGNLEEIRNSSRNYIIMGDFQLSSKCYVIFKRSLHRERVFHPKSIHGKTKRKQITNKKEQELLEECPLLRDHYDKDLSHSYKFLLATNLIHIKGGKKIFFSGLKDHLEKWKIDWEYIRKNQYAPQSCEHAECPYVNKCCCKNLLDKLERKVKKVSDSPQYVPLEEACDLMNQYLQSALDSKGNNIHLIKAQTALGKTTAYCNIVERADTGKAMMIVVPTIKLQGEVVRKLEYKGVSVYATLSIGRILEGFGWLDLKAEIESMYRKGFGSRVKKRIGTYITANKEHLLDCNGYQVLKEYMKEKEKLDGSTCVVTTHARFLSFSPEILEKYEIIIDEDILMTVFKNTASIGFDELEMIMEESVLSVQNKNRINELLHKPDKSLEKTGLMKLGTKEIEQFYRLDLPIDASITDFISSDVCYIDKGQREIHYFQARTLPNVKMTIVSATLNWKLYQDYCKNRMIYYESVPFVKYKGKLKQHTAYSMSRDFIKKHDWNTILNQVSRITGSVDINKITFKILSEGTDIYFGKTEGFNVYEGQDLVVLGTPHNVPFIYQMIGMYLGYKAEGSNMNRRIVTHNEYQFSIMTFGDKDMQALQFYFLESELEQAIGRARLLRYDCTVYVFSNFPCAQAEIIQDSYLE